VGLRASAFGLQVKAYDPVVKSDTAGIASVDTLDQLLADADYITLHLPLTPATRHLIDRRALGAMRRRPVLINTSRGGLVDLEAVLEALDDGTLGGVALDVFEEEPLPADHPIRRHRGALITPHMSYYSNESEPNLIRRVAEEVARGLRGEPVLNPVTTITVAG
jgi:D-3-phosphoglycerate dehydrogenase